MPTKGFSGSALMVSGSCLIHCKILVVSAMLPLDVRSVPFSNGHHLASAKPQAIKSRYEHLKTYQKALSTRDPKENHHLPREAIMNINMPQVHSFTSKPRR